MLGRIARMSFCLNAEGNGIKKLLSYTKINRSPNNESRSEVKSASEYNHVSQLVSYRSRMDLIGAEAGSKKSTPTLPALLVLHNPKVSDVFHKEKKSLL